MMHSSCAASGRVQHRRGCGPWHAILKRAPRRAFGVPGPGLEIESKAAVQPEGRGQEIWCTHVVSLTRANAILQLAPRKCLAHSNGRA